MSTEGNAIGHCALLPPELFPPRDCTIFEEEEEEERGGWGFCVLVWDANLDSTVAPPVVLALFFCWAQEGESSNDLKTEITRLLGCETLLKESLAEESSKLAQAEAECQKLRDAEGSALSGLQTKLDSTLMEHQTLMDQFIAVQDKNSQLEAALGTCHQELESLQRIVLDLGRQNQTLQIAQERLTNRQWVADESAIACSNCQREFSISLRKVSK
ncbi:unnamed protein product [Dibothriocephalus latus]|uniref:Uncharacterized protein n=1 Tax=Dibothriocephalus latus TaxID=60516 RepID=A0A3P7L5N7_DIBLA|nr:unnamed protein product [Dibothriocephalus latus]